MPPKYIELTLRLHPGDGSHLALSSAKPFQSFIRSAGIGASGIDSTELGENPIDCEEGKLN